MRKTLILLFIFVLAFSIRIVYLSTNQRQIESDEVGYDIYAMRLVETGQHADPEGEPSAYRLPLYPAFLALVYRVCGHDYFAARLGQALLSSLMVCFFYLIAEKIFNKPTAMLTGIFSSFYMTYVFYTNFLLTETFFSFILAAIVYLTVVVKKPELSKMCFLGILCGVLTLIRSSGFFMPLIVAIILLLKGKKRTQFFKKSFMPFTLLFICFGFVLLPWTIRNYRLYERFIPTSTSAGQNMYQAVKPAYGKIPEMGPREDAVAEIGFSIPNEAERSDYFMKKALEAYRENPRGALRSFIIRFLFFWNVIDWNVTNGDIVNYHFIFIFPFAFLGVFYSLRTGKDIITVSFVILYFTSLLVLFQGAPRFRMPIDGYIIMLGCYGIYEVVNKEKRKIYPVTLTSAYFLFTYFLYRHSLQVKYFIKGLMEKIGLW